MNNVLELTVDLPYLPAGTWYRFNERTGNVYKIEGEAETKVNINLAVYLWVLRKARVYDEAELVARNMPPWENPYKYFNLIE